MAINPMVCKSKEISKGCIHLYMNGKPIFDVPFISSRRF